jgi:hypothetical protein
VNGRISNTFHSGKFPQLTLLLTVHNTRVDFSAWRYGHGSDPRDTGSGINGNRKTSSIEEISEWISNTSQPIGNITRCLTPTCLYAHNDLKWRNILVDNNGKVFLIDCPNGLLWIPPFLQYRIIKDLACLDKVAKYHLSRTQRLRFYQHYAQKTKLDNQTSEKYARYLLLFGRE